MLARALETARRTARGYAAPRRELNHSERARRDNYRTIAKTPTVELRILGEFGEYLSHESRFNLLSSVMVKLAMGRR